MTEISLLQITVLPQDTTETPQLQVMQVLELEQVFSSITVLEQVLDQPDVQHHKKNKTKSCCVKNSHIKIQQSINYNRQSQKSTIKPSFKITKSKKKLLQNSWDFKLSISDKYYDFLLEKLDLIKVKFVAKKETNSGHDLDVIFRKKFKFHRQNFGGHGHPSSHPSGFQLLSQ